MGRRSPSKQHRAPPMGSSQDSLESRKTKKGIQKTRGPPQKPRSQPPYPRKKECAKPSVSKSSNVSTNTSKPLKRVAALVRLVAAAAQYAKSSYIPDPAPSTIETPTRSAANGEVIKMTMAQIYGDIDKAWLSGMTNQESSCVSQIIDHAARGSHAVNAQNKPFSITRRLSYFKSQDTKSRSASLQLTLCRRYAAVATTHDWTMLSILAYSNSFRNACRNFDESSWECLMQTISQQYVSLELFFKVRGLDWATPLHQLKTCFSPDLVASYFVNQRPRELPADLVGRSHGYVVPSHDGTLHRPNYQGKLLVDNTSNTYDPQVFQQDPSLRGPNDSTCHNCSQSSCDCEPSACEKVTRPLVELVHCLGQKGIGIRSLQRINKGDAVNEYVGELNYAMTVEDPTYALELEHPLDDRMQTDNAILIDAQVFGNWTRYINASCNPSLKFVPAVVGRRRRMMIVATRDIDIFEELTISYGDGYWLESDTMMCECNEPNCRYANLESKEKIGMIAESDVESMDIDKAEFWGVY